MSVDHDPNGEKFFNGLWWALSDRGQYDPNISVNGEKEGNCEAGWCGI